LEKIKLAIVTVCPSGVANSTIAAGLMKKETALEGESKRLGYV
jgi:fructose-specific phosphotransferase system component IIB